MPQKIDNDTNCLLFLQQDNPDALEYLIRVYFPVVCSYANKIIDNWAEAEDIAEELFIKLWERRNTIKNFNEIKGFLYTAARNASLNLLRGRNREKKRHLEFVQNQDADPGEFIYEEMLAEIRKAMQTLPEKMREIFILSYYKKMSNAEIAVHLNLSNQTVRNQKTKAIAVLKALLKEKTFFLLLGHML